MVSLTDLGQAVTYRGEGGEDPGERRGERGDSDHIVKHQGASPSHSSQGKQVKDGLTVTDTVQSQLSSSQQSVVFSQGFI